jgi:hypothetical protein
MRVLMTGMTSIQIKPPEQRRTPIKKIDVPLLIRDTLVAQGHEVDWRKVAVGESLEQYDMLFLCWGGMLSLNSTPGALGAVWAAAQPNPQVIFWDDWQFKMGFSHMRSIVKHPDWLFKKMGDGYLYSADPEEDVRRCQDVIVATCAELAAGTGKLPGDWTTGTRPDRLGLCPMYEWGDRTEVVAELPCGPGRVTFIDPSHATLRDACRVVTELGPVPRAERWALPSLSPQAEWVERVGPLRWDVAYFGSRKMGAPRLATEDDVVREIAGSRGILSPKYHHAGSGWWRSRFIYAAVTGAVLAGDPVEAGTGKLGPAYGVTPAEVEDMSPHERSDLREAQRAALYPRLWSREKFETAVASLRQWCGAS